MGLPTTKGSGAAVVLPLQEYLGIFLNFKYLWDYQKIYYFIYNRVIKIMGVKNGQKQVINFIKIEETPMSSSPWKWLATGWLIFKEPIF